MTMKGRIIEVGRIGWCLLLVHASICIIICCFGDDNNGFFLEGPNHYHILPVVAALAAGGGGSGGGFGKGPPRTKSSTKKQPSSASSGFGSTPSKTDQSDISSSSSSSSSPPRIETIDLGQNKVVRLLVPPDALNQQLKEQQRTKNQTKKKKKKKKSKNQQQQYQQPLEGGGGVLEQAITKEFYGTGDVLWPASLALGRLMAHCPSFVNDCTIMELGCGLGLVSTSCVTHASPIHVIVTDRDDRVLNHAYTSCCTAATTTTATATTTATKVSKYLMDWNDDSTWPVVLSSTTDDDTNSNSNNNTNIDVILAADVLYDKESIPSLVNVLKHFLLVKETSSPTDNNTKLRRAFLVDPIQRMNRDLFTNTIEATTTTNGDDGLDVTSVPFPGMEQDFILLSVTPSSSSDDDE